jgi:hypothetical protein
LQCHGNPEKRMLTAAAAKKRFSIRVLVPGETLYPREKR